MAPERRLLRWQAGRRKSAPDSDGVPRPIVHYAARSQPAVPAFVPAEPLFGTNSCSRSPDAELSKEAEPRCA